MRGVEPDDLVGRCGLAATATTRCRDAARRGRPLGPGPAASTTSPRRPGRGCRAAGGAAAVHDGDQSVRQRREPALAELPQRPRRTPPRAGTALGTASAVGGARAGTGSTSRPRSVSVDQGAVGPAHSAWATDSSRPPPRHHACSRPCRRRRHLGDAQLRAVPRHPRVVPGRARPPPPSGESRGPVTNRWRRRRVRGPPRGPRPPSRPAARRRCTRRTSVGPVAGELLQHAPDLAAVRVDQRVGPAQSAADRGDRGQRARLAARRVGLAAVQPLVGEVGEHHQRRAVRPAAPAQAGRRTR